MKKLKTALVGLGKVSDFHAKAFVNLDSSEFTAVCSRNNEKAQNFAKKYGVKAYTDIEEMIEKEKIDVLSICTPHPNHADYAVKAASLGCNILIEKPLASSLADCDRIIAVGDKNNVLIGTIVQRRFYKPCMRIKKAIESGKIGKPIIGMVTMMGFRDKHYYDSDPWRGTWEHEGGGVLVNQAAHQLDLLQWYMDSEIDEVYGVWENFNHDYIEVDDSAVATIKYKNGALASIVVSNSQNPALFGKVHIFGDNGASVGVQTDGGAMFIAGMSEIKEAPYNDIWTIKGEEDKLEEMKIADEKEFFSVDSMFYYHEQQIKDFLEAVLNNRRPLVDAMDGRKTVELFSAIYQSTKEKKAIKFPI